MSSTQVEPRNPYPTRKTTALTPLVNAKLYDKTPLEIDAPKCRVPRCRAATLANGGNTAAQTTTKETTTMETTTPTLPQCWQDMGDIIEADTRRVILYGAPATGKTFAALNMGKPRNAYRLICSEDMTDADIVGCWQPSREGWHWREGMAIKAWREGSRLVIDEIDRASGDVLSVLLAMTDTVESSSWRNPETGEIVTPHPEFSVVMTTNLEHMGDLPEALTSRFPVRIHIDAPHPDSLARIPVEIRDTAAALAVHPDIEQRVSMRAWLELARLEVKLGRARAAELILGKDRAAELATVWSLATLANVERTKAGA